MLLRKGRCHIQLTARLHEAEMALEASGSGQHLGDEDTCRQLAFVLERLIHGSGSSKCCCLCTGRLSNGQGIQMIRSPGAFALLLANKRQKAIECREALPCYFEGAEKVQRLATLPQMGEDDTALSTRLL